MRIVGGKWRGRKLSKLTGNFLSPNLRPTMDRVRETIFNILAHGVFFDVKGTRVLDLFCGTGALGFEALSRGAKHVSFVDSDKTSISILSENISILNADKEVMVLQVDATKLRKNTGQDYDLIFLDPPYGSGRGELAIDIALKQGWISKNALVVWEEKNEIFPPKKLNLIKSRPIGNICLNFLKLSNTIS